MNAGVDRSLTEIDDAKSACSAMGICPCDHLPDSAHGQGGEGRPGFLSFAFDVTLLTVLLCVLEPTPLLFIVAAPPNTARPDDGGRLDTMTTR